MGLEQCQTLTYSGSFCNRPIVEDGKCICHWDDPTKNLTEFQHEVTQELKRKAEVADLTGFVFPAGSVIRPRTPQTQVVFDRATFLGRIDFNKAHFHGHVSFAETHFTEEVTFDKCNFAQGVEFKNTIFDSDVRFCEAQSAGPFRVFNCTFPRGADFGKADFKSDLALYSVKGAGLDFQKSKMNQSVWIEDCNFSGSLSFTHADIKGPFILLRLTCEEVLDISNTKFHNQVKFTEGTLKGGLRGTALEANMGLVFKFVTVIGRADFTRARLSGNSEFVETHFDHADFNGLHILGSAHFLNTDFEFSASFRQCQIRSPGKLVFDGSLTMDEVFLGTADFRFCRLDELGGLVFRFLDLSHVRFLGTDLTKVEFDQVDWPSQLSLVQTILRKIIPKKWLGVYGMLHGRTCIYDETVSGKLEPDLDASFTPVLSPEGRLSTLAEAYRQLQINYDLRYRYQEASGFYIGEQEVKRKMKWGIWQILCMRFLYLLFSQYGQRWLRPFGWLILLLCATPALLLGTGVWLENPDCRHTDGCHTLYQIGICDGTVLPALADYRHTFYLNLGWVSFSRSDIDSALRLPWQRALITLERLLAVIMASFIVVALRRQHKRKSF